MAGHAQLKFVMTECLKTQIRLTRHISLILSKPNSSRWKQKISEVNHLAVHKGNMVLSHVVQGFQTCIDTAVWDRVIRSQSL